MARTRAKLGWLDSADARHRQRRPVYEIVIFRELGLYPRGTYVLPDSLFHADDEVVFSVVRGVPWDIFDPELPFTELRSLSPGHLRLVSALMLCEVRNGSRLIFYPEIESRPLLDARRLQLDSPSVLAEIRDLVMGRCREQLAIERVRRHFRPPERPYDLWTHSEFAIHRLPEFFEALNPVDYVVYRGMHALMKADMLSRHPEFREEATTACYVALDASFSAVQEHLVQSGIVNPSARDAAQWVHRHFNEPFGLPAPGADERYFGEMYEQRIMTLHPKSRHGAVPVAPLMYEDYMFMRRDLREFFAYLLTGRHGEDFQRDVDVHLGKRRPYER
ncbi:hypothetical protein [Luteibacter aegosomatissinici]|uniref:hypothetical protein n=1 Tax=Luteibacter aegosomatissinici TaxID=2911539 RepID=UPI001FFBBDDE|nr:hypothetical protein [Luteibacter aegosomatissinici]UPG92669.1 hypothetical protein L2Y97_12410 [Luteibacter aegosomatissinici]